MGSIKIIFLLWAYDDWLILKIQLVGLLIIDLSPPYHYIYLSITWLIINKITLPWHKYLSLAIIGLGFIYLFILFLHMLVKMVGV